MRKCPFCGEMIPSDVNICPICGEDLPSGEMIECPICGEQIEKGTNICPYCQEEISENLIVDSPQTTENQAIEEARRKAEEERAAEEARRKAEEERAAEEARRKAEEERAAEEARRKAEEERAAEETRRKAEEERAAEEARRKAKEERAAEEARRKAEEERAAEEARRKADEERAAEEARRKIEEERLTYTSKTEEKGNNKSKIITISAIIGVLLIVAGIIIFVLLRNEETTPTGYKKLSPIELTDSVKSRLPEGTAILATIDNGNIHRLYYQTDGQIMLYDAESNTTHEIDIDGIYSGATIESAKLSPDEKYIMMVAGKGEGMNSKLLRLNVMTTNVSEIASGEVELSGKGYKVTTDGKIFYYDNSGELTASEDIEQTEPAEEDNPEKAPQETKSKPQSSQQNKGKSKQQKTKTEPEPEPEQPQQSQGTGFRLIPVDKIPD